MVCLKSRQKPSIPLSTWDDFFNKQAPALRLIALLYQTSDLCATIREFGTQSLHQRRVSHLPLRDILSSAARLEEEIKAWGQNMPTVWEYPCIDISDQVSSTWSQAFMDCPGRPLIVHTYRSLSVAGGWNLVRVARLMLNQSIVECCTWLLTSNPLSNDPFEQYVQADHSLLAFENTQRQMQEAHSTIRMMIDEIFASVYSHLHLSIEGKPAPASSKDVPAIRGLFLLWPLRAAVDAMAKNGGNGNNIAYAQRRIWLKRLLEFISQDLSIAQASSVVDII